MACEQCEKLRGALGRVIQDSIRKEVWRQTAERDESLEIMLQAHLAAGAKVEELMLVENRLGDRIEYKIEKIRGSNVPVVSDSL